MKAVLPYLVAGAAFATLGVLLFGIANMFRKTPNPRRANKLMQWRVGLQAAAVLLLVVLLLLSRH